MASTTGVAQSAVIGGGYSSSSRHKFNWKRFGKLLIDLDIPLLVFCVLASGFTHWYFGSRTNERPFLLHDVSIWYPILPPTVPIERVFAIAIFIYFPVIVIAEYCLSKHKKKSLPIRRILALRFGMGLLCSLFLAVIFVEAGKNIVGRLRPCFGEICMGDHTNGNWKDINSYGKFMSGVECKNVDLKKVKDGRRSFPSGHSAVAIGTAFYFQLWLLKWTGDSHVDGIAAQCLLIVGMLPMTWGFWVACSRVFDNAHRVSDIIAGGFLGIWASAVVFWHVCKESHMYIERIQNEEQSNHLAEEKKNS